MPPPGSPKDIVASAGFLTEEKFSYGTLELMVEVDVPIIPYCWWVTLGNTDHVCSQRTISSVRL